MNWAILIAFVVRGYIFAFVKAAAPKMLLAILLSQIFQFLDNHIGGYGFELLSSWDMRL